MRPTARGVGNRCTAARRLLRTAHPRFGRMRRRAPGPRRSPRRPAGPGQRQTSSTTSRSPRPPGQGGARDDLRVPTGASRLSPDSTEPLGERGRDADHHTHATRKGHSTWRFTPIPWGWHSSGRERWSGRRFPSGLPQGDHVKVAGRGAGTCRSCRLADMTSFGSAQETTPTAGKHRPLRWTAARRSGASTGRAGNDYCVAGENPRMAKPMGASSDRPAATPDGRNGLHSGQKP